MKGRVRGVPGRVMASQGGSMASQGGSEVSQGGSVASQGGSEILGRDQLNYLVIYLRPTLEHNVILSSYSRT